MPLVCLCLGLQRLPASSGRRPTVQHRWYPRSLRDDCTPTVHRLPEEAHQSVLHVTTAPTLLQTLTRRLRQSQCIIQLATGQQSGVRGDGSAAKLQPYTAVETERGTGVGAFTHWVPPRTVRYQEPKQSITTSLALMITTVLCYSATSGSSVADYGKPCRVDMGNPGLDSSSLRSSE